MLEAVNVERLIVGEECMVYGFALADQEITAVFQFDKISKSRDLKSPNPAKAATRLL